MGIVWSDDQKKAIKREGKILVSAAAGSGKTAVLVERIIQLILSKKIDIDKILVVTFTKAAANEMKERIVAAIADELSKKEDPFLRKQLMLVKRANISTLHSFCFNLIRSNFYLLGISPNVKIASDEEIQVMKKETLKEVLNEMYKEGVEGLDMLIRRYADYKDDESLRDDILELISFEESLPFRKKWQDRILKDQENIIALENFNSNNIKDDNSYNNENAENIEDNNLDKSDKENTILTKSDVLKKYVDIIAENIEYNNYILERAIADCISLGDEYSIYLDILKEDKHLLDSMLDDVFGLSKKVQDHNYTRWPPRKSLKCPEIDSIHAKREFVKGNIKKIQEFASYESIDDIVCDVKDTYSVTKTIFTILDRFYDAYTKCKFDKNILDYADLEHLAIQLLYKEDDSGKMVYTDLALEIQNSFYEVEVDEYQDTNLVQESIISAVSGDNLFEVGDVKQSIYGFRNARPDLFMEKYNRYEKDIPDDTNYYNIPGQVILLHENYRSKENIIEFVNGVFETIMNNETGIIEYDDSEKLYYGNKGLSKIPDRTNDVIIVEDSDISIEDIYTEEELEEIGDVDFDFLDDYNRSSKEAIVIAEKIKEIKKEYAKEGREFKYSDIVILLRSVKNKAKIYEDVLTQMGIPAICETGEGYLSLNEIKLLSNYLKIIANPFLDIAFLSVMRSYFGEFEIDEITRIRVLNKKDGKRKLSMYESCLMYLGEYESLDENSENTIEDSSSEDVGQEEFLDDQITIDLKKKLKKFLDKIEEYRVIDRNYGALEVIKRLLYDEGYVGYIMLKENSEYILDNISKYLEKITNLKELGIYYVKDIVTYLDEIEEAKVELAYDVDTSNMNAVLITTVHKSKGLQYPVVILADADKRKNDISKRADFVYSERLGLGSHIYNEKLRIKYDSLYRKVISYENEIEEIEEEKRILYVAITRAIEKIVIVGSRKNSKEYMEKIADEVSDMKYIENGKYVLPAKYINESTSYLRNILASIYLTGCDANIQNIQIEEIIRDELDKLRINISDNIIPKYIYDAEKVREKENIAKNGNSIQDLVKEKKESILENENNYNMLPNKISVSNITSRITESNNIVGAENTYDTSNIPEDEEVLKEKDIYVDLPRFMQKSNITAKERGTLIHSIFENLPILTREEYNNLDSNEKCEKVREYIQKLRDDGIITEDEYSIFTQREIANIAEIYDNDIYQVYILGDEKNSIYKEKSFYTEISSQSLKELAGFEDILNESNIIIQEGQKTMMQGVIDVYIVLGNDIYLIDYKTDRVYEKEKLIKRYDMQLKLYEYALRKEYGKDYNIHKYIYSTTLKEFIHLDKEEVGEKK